jgi:hypothetical protein
VCEALELGARVKSSDCHSLRWARDCRCRCHEHGGASLGHLPGDPGAAREPLAVGAGTAAVGVGYKIEYLARGTTYHYRLTATKAGHAISTAYARSPLPGKPEPLAKTPAKSRLRSTSRHRRSGPLYSVK